MVDWNNMKSSSARNLGNNGHMLWINGTELGIVRIFGDLHVVVAFLPLSRLSIDVTELGAPDSSKPELEYDHKVINHRIGLHKVSHFQFFYFFDYCINCSDFVVNLLWKRYICTSNGY